MNLDTKFVSVLSDWCTKNEILWEYDSPTMVHTFSIYPSDPIERSLEWCFGVNDPPVCRFSHRELKPIAYYDLSNLKNTILKALELQEHAA